MLSTDSKILEKDSEAQNRMKDYAGLTDELHIIIYTASSRRYKFEQVEPNLFLYPTNNFFRLGYFFSAYNVSKRIIKDTRGWLITTQDPFETGLVGFWLKNKYNLPLQIQIHTDFLSPYFWRESLKNKVRVLIAKKILLSANNIRVVSRRIKNSLRALNWRSQVHITVLPIHTDIAKIKNSPINMDLHKKYPDYNFIILMASRLTKEKNINLAIEAMKEVVQNNQDILLLIVGDGPEHVNLKFQISSLKLQNSVIIENWSQDLASYYKTADLF